MEKTRLTRDIMAARLAAEFQDGWIVNLGVGMPTMCSDYIPADRFVILHSENGVIGYGRTATVEEAGPYVVNAGLQPIMLEPWASILHHADAFGVIRRGMLDAGVLGAYEAAANGDFANWKTAGRQGGGIGGAMDIAVSAKRVYVLMEHTQRTGEPRLLRECTLPVTAKGVLTLVMTDLGLFEPTGEAFRALELAPGFTLDDVQALTDAPVIAAPGMKEVQL